MVRIKFETGQTVNFDGQPTQKDIEEIAGQLKLKTPIESTKSVEKFGVYKGVAKGVGETVTNLGQMTSKLLGNIPGKVGEFFKGGAEYAQELKDTTLKAQTTQEKIGKGIEQVAEFFIPASKITKGQKALDVLLDGSKLSGLTKSIAKVSGKAGLEALGAGGVSLAQSGDIKEAGITGATAGLLKGTTGVIGEVAKKAKIPEKAYTRIFKSTADDAVASIREEINAGLEKTNPQKFAEYVRIGAINPSTKKVNETLAREAIDRGLKGSIENMTKQTIQNIYDLESQARNALKGKSLTIKNGKSLANILRETANDWKDVAGNQTFNKANNLADIVEKGKIDGGTALTLRRFLDGLRIESSYNPGVKRSIGQANYKFWSDRVRSQLNKLPGVGKIMDDYRFNIEALESLGKELARKNNRAGISAIDTLLLGTGFATGMTPTAVGLTAVKKATGNAKILTKVGQAIEKSGVSSKLGIGAKGFTSSKISDIINQ